MQKIITYIVHRYIIYCTSKATKYQNNLDTMSKQDDKYCIIYAIGLNVMKRDKWLKRIKTITKHFS